MSTKQTWERTLVKMIAQAEHQEWWAISASLYCALNEVRKLTSENRREQRRKLVRCGGQ
jgi:hypothetical protein